MLENIKGGYSPDVYDLELTDLEKYYAKIYETGMPFNIGETVYRPFKIVVGISQGYSGRHPAYDFPIPNDTTLYNPFPGKAQVSFMGETGGYAYNLRLIYPDYGFMSVFAHLRAVNTFVEGLKVGDWVDPISMVCFSDNTGNSTGPHLHYEIRKPPYLSYSNCINYWNMLKELPLIPPIEPNLEIPEFPEPIKIKILANPLNIRESETTNSRIVGKAGLDKIIICNSARYVDKNLWANIGYHQYVAMVYYYGNIKNVFAEFIK